MEEKRSPVGRPVFKTGRGRSSVPGGFDSHSFPPSFLPRADAPLCCAAPRHAAYRAPEASHGKDLESPADAFSFGVLLYEMLTRQLPGRRSPVPSVVRPEVSREIDDLVDALLEDDPTRRPTLATAAAKLSLAMGGNPLYLLE